MYGLRENSELREGRNAVLFVTYISKAEHNVRHST